MNAEQSSTPAVEPEAPRVTPRRRGAQGALWLVPALLLGGVLAWHVVDSRRDIDSLRSDINRRFAELDAPAHKEMLAGLSERIAALEARQEASRDQEAALQALFQDVASGREAADLLEIERDVTLAAQQLQLAGDVPVALLALRAADAQLARLDKASLLPLRKALAADIARLDGLPRVDLAGISLRLEEVLRGIDKFPFAAHARPHEDAPVAAPDDTPTALPWWRMALADAWQEIRNLIRIQRFDRDEAPLLAPEQGFFLRENLKLRLLSARLALFARDEASFRNELKEAQAWLARYFAGDDRAVAAATAQLKELGTADIVLELPDLRASQQALTALRDSEEKQ
jgi:uroporphyrin-3 C-methyltransferase